MLHLIHLLQARHPRLAARLVPLLITTSALALAAGLLLSSLRA